MARIIAVLDIGKTNVKVVAHDLLNGADLTVLRMPNRVHADGPYPHFDVEAIWTFFLAGLREIAAAHPVEAISITTHGAAAALLGADGALAMPVLDYEYSGPDDIAADYDAIRPPFGETFSPRLPMGLNLGAQLFWQQRMFPDAFADVVAIVTYPQYWAWRLTGVAACEVTSLGCHTDLWAPRTATFSSLVERAGWASRMAPVRSAFDRLGPILPDIAVATGLAAGTPVQCGLHDSNASLLPHLAMAPPFAVVSTGTWAIVFAVGGRLDGLDAVRDTLANIDAHGRPVPSGRFMAGREYERIAGPDPVEASDADVAGVIARGIALSPGWAPGTGPFPQTAPRWPVDPETLRPAEITAAAGLYLALMTETVLDLIGAGGPVIIEGPLGGNSVYLRALAGLTGRPVHVAAGTTGTTAGAALLAAGPEGFRSGPPGGRVERPAWAVGLPPYRDIFRTMTR